MEARVVRNTATVLFTDLVDSTVMRVALGDDRADEVRREHDTLLRAAMVEHHGHIVKTLGDGMLVTFDSASDAVDAAVAAHRAVALRNSHAAPPLVVRIGLSSGDVAWEDDDCFGTPVVQAKRLCDFADGGTIVVAEVVRLLVGSRGGHSFEPLGHLVLKGLAVPTPAFRVEMPSEGGARSPDVKRAVVRLPARLTSFVGRGEERHNVAQRIAEARLVVLVGPGGVGKTRLAIEVGEEVAAGFPGGVWFADLASAVDSDGVLAAVATAMGLTTSPGRGTLETLVARLAVGSSLVVLDNCEQVLDPVVSLVSVLLAGAPGLRLLATSREALGVPGEVVVLVMPLQIPTTDGVSIAEVEACDAVRLFVDRASAVDASFALDPDNAPIVASVCRRLDGVPLAVELAAARLDVLGLAQVDALLEDRFALLRAGGRGRDARHRALETTLAWSYDLLDDVERAMLDRLAVFRGSFSLDAVEAVVVDDPVRLPMVLDTLTGLVRKSLVITTAAGDHRRYRLFETVREYGWRRLAAAGDLDLRRDRHFDWAIGLALTAGEGLSGAEQAHWLDALDDDLDNLEGALERSLDDPDQAAAALEAVLGLTSYWTARGTHRVNGIRWFEAIAASATGMDAATRTQALMNACLLVLWSDLDAAATLAGAARRLAADDRVAIALAEIAAAFVACMRGETGAAEGAERAIPALAGDPASLPWAYGARALALAHDGALDEGYECLLEVAASCRAQGDEHMYGAWLGLRADVGSARGERGQARVEGYEALAIARNMACASCEAQAITSLAVSSDCEEFAGPAGAARRAVELAHGIRETFNVVCGLDALAGALGIAGRARDAVTLAGATSALRESTGYGTVLPGRAGFCAQGLAMAGDMLEPGEFDALWAAGSALDYDETIRRALAS